MTVGDVIFIKDNTRPSSYRRLGPIKAFNGNKVIVGVMSDIGFGSKQKIEKLHNISLSEGATEDEIENDGSLYGGKNIKTRKFLKKIRTSRHRKSRHRKIRHIK